LWLAEVQNLPLERDGLRPLFPDGTIELTLRNQDIERLGAFITVDPSGRKITSDDTAIGAHVIWEGMRIELAGLSGKIRSPKETIMDALALAIQYDAPIIFVEAIAYQESLCYWGNNVLQELHLANTYRFEPISAGQASKLARIRAWVGELLAGQYFIVDNEVRADILFQGLQFDSSRNDNKDDLLDCAAYGTVVRNQFLQAVLNESTKFASNQIKRAPKSLVLGSLGQRMRALYRHGGEARRA
jgi:hypothetical protein